MSIAKVKAFFIKYKWWVAGGIVAIFAIYMLRGSSSSGSGGGVVSTSYTTADGSIGQTYTDPTLMLAQLNNQSQLALQTATIQGQLNALQIESDLTRYTTDSNKAISLATIDANKWLGQMDSNTQIALGQLNATTTQYVADAGVKTAQINADVINRQTQASEFIANKQYKLQKSGQEYAAIQGLLNWGSGLFGG